MLKPVEYDIGPSKFGGYITFWKIRPLMDWSYEDVVKLVAHPTKTERLPVTSVKYLGLDGVHEGIIYGTKQNLLGMDGVQSYPASYWAESNPLAKNWKFIAEGIWSYNKPKSLRVIKLLNNEGFVVDHTSIPYPRKVYATLDLAFEAGVIIASTLPKSKKLKVVEVIDG